MIRKLLLFVLAISLFTSNCYAALTERYLNNTLYAASGSASGTATGGGNDYILLAADASTNDDDYNTYGITITGGTGTAGENRRIIDYDATGNVNGEKYAQVDAVWSVNPSSDTTYEIIEGSDSNNGVGTGLFDSTDGAYGTLQFAADNVSTVGGGMRVNILSGRDWVLLSEVNFDTRAGSLDNPLIYSGYGSSPGDATKAVIDGNSVAVDGFVLDKGSIYIMDLEFKGVTGDCIATETLVSSADNCGAINVLMSQSGSKGIHLSSSTSNWRMVNCEVTNTTNDGFDSDSGGVFIGNYIHDTGLMDTLPALLFLQMLYLPRKHQILYYPY